MTAAPKKLSPKTLNIISAVLMVVMLVCQFLPYWQTAAGEVVSLHGYVWFPTVHTDLNSELLPLVEKYPCNQAALACVLVLALCVLSIYFCLAKANKPSSGFMPVLTGAAGLLLYLTSPVMRAGFLCWLHVVLLAMMLVLGALTMAQKRRG